MDNKPSGRGNVATSDPTDPEEEPSRPEKLWSGSDLLLITSTIIFTFFIGLALTSSLMTQKVPNHPEQAIDTVSFTITASIVEFIVLVGCVYLLGLRRKAVNWDAMGVRPLVTIGVLTALGIGVLEFAVENAITYGSQALFQINDTNAQAQSSALQGLSWVNLVILAAITGLALPFAEEVFFRGVLYNYLKGHWGIWVGIVVSALVYALISAGFFLDTLNGIAGLPMDILNGVAGIVLSLFAIWAYERTKSLWGAIIVHVISSMGSLIIFYALSTPWQHLPIL
ncbi:MAG TPA: CPBP family intramembrane glutamic endopeptidase [Ktedonobacteraceae bacterium]|jgi:hypothetical protein|nr:CPBP family intramembrane glutamic endopeptidase [Ktedonobacteraceae bacterium]